MKGEKARREANRKTMGVLRQKLGLKGTEFARACGMGYENWQAHEAGRSEWTEHKIYLAKLNLLDHFEGSLETGRRILS